MKPCARTRFEAEALWANEKYELIILDVSLPDAVGFDLCTKIRKAFKIPSMFLRYEGPYW